MAEINAKDLTTKTSPASTDSMLLFGTTTNEGAKITVDNLAENILGRLSTKTFPNQVGGSSAATILAQLATLNSNIAYSRGQITSDSSVITGFSYFYAVGKVVVVPCSIRGNGEAIPANTIVASGLPNAKAAVVAALIGTGNAKTLLEIKPDGTIRAVIDIPNAWVYGSLVYMST